MFRANQHDYTVRTFLGQSISNGPDVINVVARADGGDRRRPQRGHAGEGRGGRFLSKKLWESFAYQAPSATIVNALGDVLVANDFDITPWVKAMLMPPGVPHRRRHARAS